MKTKLTKRQMIGTTVASIGLFVSTPVDGSTFEIGFRLIGLGLIATGAWIAQIFYCQRAKLAEQEAEQDDGQLHEPPRQRKEDHDPYPEE